MWQESDTKKQKNIPIPNVLPQHRMLGDIGKRNEVERVGVKIEFQPIPIVDHDFYYTNIYGKEFARE